MTATVSSSGTVGGAISGLAQPVSLGIVVACFVVPETDPDRSSGEVEAVHLLERFLGRGGVGESKKKKSVLELRWYKCNRSRRYLLDKSITLAPPAFFLLELDKLELSERLENGSKIIFSDVEMDIPHV